MEIKNNILKKVTNEDISDSGIFVVPETVEVIGQNAFMEVTDLEEVVFHENIKAIGKKHFFLARTYEE